MKNITNILSYLWLLLLMVTACSDLEEEVGPMHVEEEVELNIQLHVPNMQASTRAQMVITENISSIVAIAFDESGALIKKVDAILPNQNHETHSGTLKIKVPKRTRTIHFLGNYTKDDIGSITSLGTLNSFTTTDVSTMRYWGMTTFDGTTAQLPVTLHRNMAKLTLKKNENLTGSCYIAGFVNRNLSGTVVPNDYVVGDTPTIPDGVTQGNYTEDNALGNVYYLFEHANDKNNPLYVIIEFRAKYYKIAFAAGDDYFPILRNRKYEINVTESLDEMYAEADYTDAVNSQYPINDLVITSVPMTVSASPTEVLNQSGQTSRVTVTIPKDIGITELNVPTHDAFTIAPPNGLTAQNGKYTVTPGNSYEFTLTVNEDVTAGNKTISFTGRGKYLKATGSANIGLYDNVQLTVTADPATIYNTAGSTRNVTVSVPQGITTLTIPSATTDAFIVTPQNGLSANNDGSYTVSAGDYLFTLQLRTDGNVGDPKTVTFNGSGQYKRATGSTTLTLVQAPAQEILPVYELWFENNNTWNGSQGYATFFTKNGDITTGNGNASNMEDTFYDGTFTVNDVTYSGADNHRSYAMTMGDGKSIGFTITEPRWLTLLVASSGNAPSINLNGTLSEGSWATENSSAAVVPTNYNFGNGEIGTNGRLICYTLPAGTYTLQGSDAAYLLYYLRVSTERPTMTDIVQPTAADYSLTWSGGEWGNDIKIGDTYFVDDDAMAFTPTLSYTGLTLSTISNLTIVTTTYRFEDVDDDTGTRITETVETREYKDQSIPVTLDTNLNAGTYSLSGKATVNSEYKYAAFYDYAQLNAVEFSAKNTIKVNLYNSWDGNAAPVTEFVAGGQNNILGFKMPMKTLPMGSNKEINFTINNWQRYESGLGVNYDNAPNYKLTSQTQRDQNDENKSYNRIHPRPEWIYKMSWQPESVAGNQSITVTTSDADVYFSNGDKIAQSVTIATPVTGTVENPLSIALDFYADENGDGNIDNQGNSFNNLLLKLTDQTTASKVWLEATISSEDAQRYKGETIQLKGDFPSINGAYSGWAMQWAESRQSSSTISYTGPNYNGQGLQFTIDANNPQTTYLIEWVFKHSANKENYPGYGDIAFTYTISNVDGKNYNITGDTQATIAFTNEPTNNGEILVAANGIAAANNINLSLEYGENSAEEFTVDVTVPNNVSGINISAPSYLAVSIGKLATGTDYPGSPVTVNGNYTFTDSDKETPPRFKFKLNGTPTNNQSVITITDVNGQATPATITVNWTQRGAESNQTTIWSGAMDLQWTRNYLEATTNQLQAGTQVKLNFTTINDDQNGQIKLHDRDGNQIASENIQGITYDSNNGVSVGNDATQLTFTLQNNVNGLKINGNNVRMTSIVVKYPVIYCNFSGTNPVYGWYTTYQGNIVTRGERAVVDGTLRLTNEHVNTTNGVQASLSQAAIDVTFEKDVAYTLTFRIRADVKVVDNNDRLSNEIPIAFQDDIENSWPLCGDFKTSESKQNAQLSTEWTTVTLTAIAEQTSQKGRIIFSFGHLVGSIYIDDIKLVKN